MPKDSPVSGSSSISSIVPHSRPTLGEREQAAVAEVLASGQIAQGPQVQALEEEAAGYFGGAGAVAVGSGSQALLLALKSLGLGEGARVAMPAFTCSAVLHAVEWAGADPVLMDTAEGELAPDPSTIEKLEGPIDAIIIVHPWGNPLDTAAWKDTAPLLIEDCAQSMGARWADRPVGSLGDAAMVSFYATKMLCAGEGGLLTAPKQETIEAARDLRDYDKKPEHARRFNFKMSDLQAALARIQWSRLSEFVDKRRSLAQRYDTEVPALGLTPVVTPPEATCTYYRYLCWAGRDVSPLLDYCQSNGIYCRRPVPITLDRLLKLPPMPNTMQAWNRVIGLPIYPTLKEMEQDQVLEVLGMARGKGLLD